MEEHTYPRPRCRGRSSRRSSFRSTTKPTRLVQKNHTVLTEHWSTVTFLRNCAINANPPIYSSAYFTTASTPAQLEKPTLAFFIAKIIISGRTRGMNFFLFLKIFFCKFFSWKPLKMFSTAIDEFLLIEFAMKTFNVMCYFEKCWSLQQIRLITQVKVIITRLIFLEVVRSKSTIRFLNTIGDDNTFCAIKVLLQTMLLVQCYLYTTVFTIQTTWSRPAILLWHVLSPL